MAHSTATIQFRPGDLGGVINTLLLELQVKQPGLTKSDVVRDGLRAFWPQIAAYLLARQESAVDTATLARIVGSCSRAIELGVTPDQLESRLEAFVEELNAASANAGLTPFPVGSPAKPARPGQ